jgi:hypothetical protein
MRILRYSFMYTMQTVYGIKWLVHQKFCVETVNKAGKGTLLSHGCNSQFVHVKDTIQLLLMQCMPDCTLTGHFHVT